MQMQANGQLPEGEYTEEQLQQIMAMQEMYGQEGYEYGEDEDDDEMEQ